MALTEPPRLVTERLELRLPVAADLAPMAAIVSEPETSRYLGPSFDPADHFMRFSRNAGSWLLYGYGGFIARLRGSEEVIGSCGLFHSWRGIGDDFDDVPEAAWMFRRDQVGRGFGHEAMSAVLGWFDANHGPRRVTCITAPDNAASIRLAAKLGFVPVREAVMPEGDPVRLFERLA